MDTTLTLRTLNAPLWSRGFLQINENLRSLQTSGDGDVHLYVGPPDSFVDVNSSKINVGLTLTDYADLNQYQFSTGITFEGYAGRMDLLLVPNDWCRRVLQSHLDVPIEVVSLGHDHERWHQPARDCDNMTVLILDRGRDRDDSIDAVSRYFQDVTCLDCREPFLSESELRAEYRMADIFFKWGSEGWCFPILEAMSAGCLVISGCDNLPYLVDGKNSLVFTSIEQIWLALGAAKKSRMFDLKLAAQKTAADLTWAAARGQIVDAITNHIRGGAESNVSQTGAAESDGDRLQVQGSPVL